MRPGATDGSGGNGGEMALVRGGEGAGCGVVEQGGRVGGLLRGLIALLEGR